MGMLVFSSWSQVSNSSDEGVSSKGAWISVQNLNAIHPVDISVLTKWSSDWQTNVAFPAATLLSWLISGLTGNVVSSIRFVNYPLENTQMGNILKEIKQLEVF